MESACFSPRVSSNISSDHENVSTCFPTSVSIFVRVPTFVIAQINAELANATPQIILNNTPFPIASIKGFPIIVPIQAKMFLNKLFIATAEELRWGTASMR